MLCLLEVYSDTAEVVEVILEMYSILSPIHVAF